jgi:hypothetical protein
MDGITILEGDGGSIDYLYHQKKLEAVLEVEGVGAGYSWCLDEGYDCYTLLTKLKRVAEG